VNGEPIREAKLVKAKGSGFMAAILPSGMRAVSTVISPETGADETISSKELIYGAENMAAVLANLKAKKPFKVIAFGDSVTAGAQRYRSTWALSKAPEAEDFMYYSHLARLLGESFGYKGVTYKGFGHGGWTAKGGLTVIDKEVIPEAGKDDLVILQFGGNDLAGGASCAQWKEDMKALIAKVRTKTGNIIIMGIPYGTPTAPHAEEITKTLKELVAEEKLGAFDLTKFSGYRGEKFAYSIYANMFHPDFMGHITIGEMMAPMFTGKDAVYPE
jgi:lysophospholipase L1-like esterase